MELNIPRFFNGPKHSYFLFGPRGTGKSTFLKSTFPDAFIIDLLKPDVQRLYQTRPETIIEQVHANPKKKIVLIDEIQEVPQLLDAIHHLIEEIPNLQFVLTGSSARKLKRSGIDLLAGRVILKSMFPFIISELQQYSNFETALQIGLLPLVYFAESPEETLQTYISLYIREEVQYEGLTRNIGNFSRFLEIMSFSHASLLNISNVARECQVERKVVENYITILEDILLAMRLPVFSKRAQRALVSHPKFYFFDSGVFRSIRPKGPLDSPHEIDGAALEGLVLQHLNAWNAYRNTPLSISFWRSRGGVEVDFILYGDEGIFAIEVKNSDKIRPDDLRSLNEFK
ncbi:ATP-binding protein, partial [bacterium]|nr:ATP-binding protein [candidate division CSSED10-310 bacterium]